MGWLTHLGVTFIGFAAAVGYVRNKLVKAGAVSEDTAKLPEEVGLGKNRMALINNLIKQGKIGRTEDGRIWWKGRIL